jgi:uncharacterized protein DUF6056
MTIRRAAFDAAIAAVLGLFLAPCLFAHPTADDFIYASNARAGFGAAWVQEYLGWNGRYASNALVLATPLALGETGYRAAAALTLALTVAAAYGFIQAWAGPALARRDALTGAGVFAALYFSQVPSLGESVYWYTSAATYQLWVVPVLAHAALLIRYGRLDRPTIADRAGLVLAGVLLVAAAGFNEVVMLFMLAAHAIWLASALRDRSPARLRAATFFVVAAASALAVLVAPGNAARRAMYAGTHQLGRSVGMTLLQTLRFDADWASSGALLLSTVLFIPFAERLPSAPRQRWIPAIGLALLVPMAAFPAYWETGMLGQHRTMDVAYFAFLVLWFGGVPAWVAAPRPSASWRSFTDAWSGPAAILLLAALAVTRNGYALGSDLATGRLAGFDREMRARRAALEACRDRGADLCEIDPLRSTPSAFTIVDVSPDPDAWVNAAYARYFRVPHVRARAAALPDVRH